MSELVKMDDAGFPATIEELSNEIHIKKGLLKAYQAKLKTVNSLKTTKEEKDKTLLDTQLAAENLLCLEAIMGGMLKAIPKVGNTLTSSGGRKGTLPDGISHKESHFAQTIADNPDIVEEVIANAKENKEIPTSHNVYKLILQKKRDDRISEEQKISEETRDIDIRIGDFKDVLKDVYNIDAIITDPPYPKEYLCLFSDLGEYASKHLKDDGFLVVYSGQYHLPEVIERISANMTYVWTFCLYHVGKKQLVNGVNIMCGWKPVLIFSNGNKKMRFAAYDVAVSEKREKDNHVWQQSESGVAHLVEVFSKPGDLVVDPFAGSGTFPKVAHKMNRNTMGAEIDSTKK